ncbi:MAG TPA: DMT family transporter [Thermoleophilaceae bacterium]|nr:DMT family transporter [Thermoleophilaceae bacterium]
MFVALAAVAWSSAGVLQRQLSLDIPTQVAGRAVFAAAALLLFLAVAERGRVVEACRSVGRAGVALALCLAVASGSFVSALNYASVARVLFIQALSPVLAALLARVLLGERISRRTGLALVVAAAGVALMVGTPEGNNAVGDALALLVALAFALALVITRHRRDVSMVPATSLSQLFLLVAFVPFASPGDVGGDDLLFLVLLGAGQMGIGLVFLVIGARLIPAAQVGLITLLEIVLGPLWVWMALSERPSAATLVGGAIVIAAIVIQSRPFEGPTPPPP